MRIYSSRIISSKPTGTAELSKEEWADLGTLQKKQGEESKCQIAIDSQNRVAAYEKYFHVKTSDTANYNFSKWSSATDYLGRHYYELMSEEKFDEDKTMSAATDLSFLERPATASVDLISPPNPSQEFNQRVVAILEAAWGKRSVSNGSSEWQWISDKFAAKLESRASGEGQILSLSIRAKR